MVRAAVDREWYLLLSDSKDLFWAFPPETDRKKVTRIEAMLTRNNVSLLAVSEQVRPRSSKESKISTENLRGSTSSDEPGHSIWLSERLFWFSQTVKIPTPTTSQQMLYLTLVQASIRSRSKPHFISSRARRKELLPVRRLEDYFWMSCPCVDRECSISVSILTRSGSFYESVNRRLQQHKLSLTYT